MDMRTLAIGSLAGLATGYALWGSFVLAQAVPPLSGNYMITPATEVRSVWVNNMATGQMRYCTSYDTGKAPQCSPWSR